MIPNQSMGIGAVSFLPGGAIQNDTEGIAIVRAGVVIQFLSYEGVFTATTGPANGISSTDIGVEESNTTTPSGFSLQLTGTGNTYGDFTWNVPAADSPGALNVGQIIN
jgi:hypothetical protein